MQKKSRRKFIKQASCAGLGYMTLLNTFLNLKAINGAAISNSSINSASAGSDYKAIVCILQAGGNDSYNMLMPYDQFRYDKYSTTRSGLAIDRNLMRQINLNSPDPFDASYLYGIHPNMPNVQQMFNDDKVAFLSNIGTLLNTTTTKSQVYAGTNLPIGLFSHADQIQQWQTGIPSIRTSKGWGGRVADIINSCNSNDNISMNVTLSGGNIFQTGQSTIEYAIDPYSGSIGVQGYDPLSTWIRNEVQTGAVDNYMSHVHTDIFKKTYNSVQSNALNSHLQFQDALALSDNFDGIPWPANSYFGQQMRMIAKTIDIQEALGFNRQIFFVTYGGWDHHDEVLDNQVQMLGDMDSGLGAFMQALESMGMENKVTTMTISEFARTLTSNGNGSDHAWGGNVMVMGGATALNGGKIYGQYPDMTLGSNIDIGSGVLIPSLSTDEYFAEIAKWFGVSGPDLNLIFPNLHNFYDTMSTDMPIGFLNL